MLHTYGEITMISTDRLFTLLLIDDALGVTRLVSIIAIRPIIAKGIWVGMIGTRLAHTAHKHYVGLSPPRFQVEQYSPATCSSAITV